MILSNFSQVLREIALNVFFYMLIANIIFMVGIDDLLIEIVISIIFTFVLRFALFIYERNYDSKNKKI